ncbi:hypothetical protein H0H87_009920 [Tephrocybe sp. NHM501043]|nr:hypothetical protein H0H87_009920 [Tephrocybe sp. NHM501043]
MSWPRARLRSQPDPNTGRGVCFNGAWGVFWPPMLQEFPRCQECPSAADEARGMCQHGSLTRLHARPTPGPCQEPTGLISVSPLNALVANVLKETHSVNMMFHTYETAVPMKDSSLPPSYTRAPRIHLGMPKPFTISSAAPGTLLSTPARLPTTRAPAGSAAAAACARCYAWGPRPPESNMNPQKNPSVLPSLPSATSKLVRKWDDGCVVHQLPAVLTTQGMFLPSHLRAQMANIFHSVSSTFPTCACGEQARGCAIRVLERFVYGSESSST